MALLCKLEWFLPRSSLLTIYKFFIRPHLDEPFSSKIESVQHNAALAITGAIRGSFREKTLPGIRNRVSTSQALDETFMFTV